MAALRTKRDGTWQTITYQSYLEQVECVSRAFIKLGLEQKGSVCILGFNSAEWFLASVAATYAGGVAAGGSCTCAALSGLTARELVCWPGGFRARLKGNCSPSENTYFLFSFK